MGMLLIVSIGRSATLDVPTEITPGLLIAVVVGNVGIGKKVGTVRVAIVRVRRCRVVIIVFVVVVGCCADEHLTGHGNQGKPKHFHCDSTPTKNLEVTVDFNPLDRFTCLS